MCDRDAFTPGDAELPPHLPPPVALQARGVDPGLGLAPPQQCHASAGILSMTAHSLWTSSNGFELVAPVVGSDDAELLEVVGG